MPFSVFGFRSKDFLVSKLRLGTLWAQSSALQNNLMEILF